MTHSANPGYEPGNHWVECPRCAFDYRAAQCKQEWTGIWVCKDCYEPRHPQDFVRGREDDIAAKGPVWPATDNTGETVDTSDLEIPPGTFDNTL